MSEHQGGAFVQDSSSLPRQGSKVKLMGDQRDNRSLGSKRGGEAGERSRNRTSWKAQDQEPHMNALLHIRSPALRIALPTVRVLFFLPLGTLTAPRCFAKREVWLSGSVDSTFCHTLPSCVCHGLTNTFPSGAQKLPTSNNFKLPGHCASILLLPGLCCLHPMAEFQKQMGHSYGNAVKLG